MHVYRFGSSMLVLSIVACAAQPVPPTQGAVHRPAPGLTANAPPVRSVRLMNLCEVWVRYRIGPPDGPRDPNDQIPGTEGKSDADPIRKPKDTHHTLAPGAVETVRLPDDYEVYNAGGPSFSPRDGGLVWWSNGPDRPDALPDPCDGIGASNSRDYDPRNDRQRVEATRPASEPNQ